MLRRQRAARRTQRRRRAPPRPRRPTLPPSPRPTRQTTPAARRAPKCRRSCSTNRPQRQAQPPVTHRIDPTRTTVFFDKVSLRVCVCVCVWAQAGGSSSGAQPASPAAAADASFFDFVKAGMCSLCVVSGDRRIVVIVVVAQKSSSTLRLSDRTLRFTPVRMRLYHLRLASTKRLMNRTHQCPTQ
jgi:hypothetical protein